MTSAIMILSLAWTLSGIVGKDYLNIGGYVGSVVADNATIAILLPALFFLVAIGLAFATGTSWEPSVSSFLSCWRLCPMIPIS